MANEKIRFVIFKDHLKAVFVLFLCVALNSISLAQDEAVAGSLSVGDGLKAGLNSSTTNFEFRENGIIISKGVYSWNWQNLLLSSDQGEGIRLLWHPGKGAFRAGMVEGNKWDESNIGPLSAAFGLNTRAAGGNSFASGWNTTASGNVSAAFGADTISSGSYSFTAGAGNIASGTCSTAFGNDTDATNSGSFAAGGGAVAGGFMSSAFGFWNYAQGDYSTSFAETWSASSHSFAIGRFNVGGGSVNSWINTDPLFEVGNGADGNNRSNALTVYKNGNATLQGVLTVAPGGDLSMGEFTASPQ